MESAVTSGGAPGWWKAFARGIGDMLSLRRPMPTRFDLYRGDLHLGLVRLAPELCDFPWYGGHFEPTPAFEPFASPFAQELEFLAAERMDEWGDVLRQIESDAGLSLVPVGGGERITGFQFHIDGNEMTWRT